MNTRTQGRIALFLATLATLAAVGCGQKGPLVKPGAKPATSAPKPASAPVDPTQINTPGISIPGSGTPGASTDAPAQIPVTR